MKKHQKWYKKMVKSFLEEFDEKTSKFIQK
jgi:hypothetical protein